MGANEKKEQVSDELGLTDLDGQESEVLGKTDSLGGDLSLELEKEYIINSKTREKMTGQDLRTLANQGKLSRELQSKLDVTQNEHKLALQRLTELERENNELATKATVSEMLRQGKPKESAESDDDDILSMWADADAEEQKPTPNPVNRRNREQTNPSQNDELKELKEKISQIEEAERRRTAESELSQFARIEQEIAFTDLKNELPDLTDQDIRSIIKTDNMATTLKIQAMDKRAQGDNTWADTYAEGRELEKKAIKMRVDAYKQQETKSVTREYDTLIEGSGNISGPATMPDGLQFDSNPEKAEQQWKEHSSQEKKKESMRRRLRVP